MLPESRRPQGSIMQPKGRIMWPVVSILRFLRAGVAYYHYYIKGLILRITRAASGNSINIYNFHDAAHGPDNSHAATHGPHIFHDAAPRAALILIL